MHSDHSVKTLEDLINVITEHKDDATSRMLRTLKGHLSLAADKNADQISLTELNELRHVLRMYLAKKREQGEFERNSVRSYMNYFRILQKHARGFSASRYSPEIEKLWLPISTALKHEYGSRDIVRDAIAKGIPPQEYDEQHLKCWREQMAAAGRHPAYIQARATGFRKRLLAAGLNSALPKLSFKFGNQSYSVPFDKFPEPLKTQAAEVLKWKVEPKAKGRPKRNRCRPISVQGLRQLFCGVLGYAQRVLGKTPETLGDLLSQEIISEYADWLSEKRKVLPGTVIDRLRLIPPLRRHPLLKDKDFTWVHDLIIEVPPDDPDRVKRQKARKFRRFSDLAPICDLLVKKADAATDARKKAILLRDALLLKFLLILAWRQRNIRECLLLASWLGGNLFKEEIPPMSAMALPRSVQKIWKTNHHAKFWQFSFTPAQMKSNRSFCAVLPRQIVPLLELYLQYRSALIKPGKADPGTLFLGNHGQLLTNAALWRYVAGVTSRYAGRQINPHLFRDIHALAWLESGRSLDDLSNNLGHVDSSFTRQTYAEMFDESYGTRGVEDWLDNRTSDSEKDSEDDEE